MIVYTHTLFTDGFSNHGNQIKKDCKVYRPAIRIHSIDKF
jgi:hypothetical protein